MSHPDQTVQSQHSRPSAPPYEAVLENREVAPDVEMLLPKSVSANKRAIIEKLIARHKLGQY